jgi:hemerythrin
MVEWRKAMSVGVPDIDDDHRYLIELINAFEQAKTDDEIDRILNELIDYTIYHFAREERYQQASLFPFREAHRKSHERLIAKVKGLSGRRAAAGVDRSGIAGELSALFREWLVEHIIKEDLLMKPR